MTGKNRRNILPGTGSVLYLLYILILLIVPASCSTGASRESGAELNKESKFPSLENGQPEDLRLKKAVNGSSHLIANRFSNDLVKRLGQGAEPENNASGETVYVDGRPVTPLVAEVVAEDQELEKAPIIADARLIELQKKRARSVPVHCVSRVHKILKEDTKGRRHQRFLIMLTNGTTVLVAHNIDLAPRVPLKVGDIVEVQGEYIWNELGGVLHYTHRSTSRRKTGGWIRHLGKIYG